MKPQPMIAVADVESTSRWYQEVLGLESGHGGSEYERLLHDGELVLQLHQWEAHEHPHLGNEGSRPYGNGVLLWFCTEDFAATAEHVLSTEAEILEQPKVNPNANHREVWLRDPNGYVVVVAGAYGDV